MSNVCWKFVKDSSTTHQNRGPTALGVLNSNSTRNLRYKTWFKVDKGARKACFMTKTLLKNAENMHKNTYCSVKLKKDCAIPNKQSLRSEKKLK